MVQHVIDTALSLGAQNVHLVYGHGGDLLQSTLSDQNLNWVLQAEQLGTGMRCSRLHLTLPMTKIF